MEIQALQEDEDTQRGRYLTFLLDQKAFGLGIKHVTEIVGLQAITPIPESPVYMKGIINLRGKIIPVIDMRLKFKEPELPYTDRTCIIIIDVQDSSIGLIVDQVSEVLTIDDENIVPPPAYGAGQHTRYLSGVGKVGNDVKLLLDCDKLFSTEEMDGIQEQLPQ